jgi:hypothetical protein
MFSSKFKSAFFFFLLFGAALIAAPTAWGQTFSLIPATATKSADVEFDVDLNVDTGGRAVSAVDAKITFDSAVLQVVEVQEGTFFPEVAQNIYAGTLYISGSFAQAGQSASGSGKLATITLKGKTADTSPLAFVCSTQSSDSNIFDTAAVPKDIISCSGTKSGSYTILGSAVGLGGGGEEEASPTPEPPVSGVALPTIFFLGLGALLTILGLAFVF